MLMRSNMIDFHAVDPAHREIDARLHNWGRWCNGTAAPSSCPMFRLTPSAPRARGEVAYGSDAVDRADAAQIGKAVQALPPKHRASINWSYVKPVSPKKAAMGIGVSIDELALLLRDARQMLIARQA